MLDLESAIKHHEEVAEDLEKTADVCALNDDGYSELECLNRASEHRQLAEWLRELKTHREIHDILLQTLVDFDLDICCEDLTDNEEEQKICEENCDNKTKGCWVRWAKMKAREANADEDSD